MSSSSLKKKTCSFLWSPTKFLLGAQVILLGSLVLYGLTVVFVMTPFIQTHVLFAHRILLRGNTKFDHPEYYGLAPGKTVNVQFPSLDNTTLGGWFIFPSSFHNALPFPPPSRDLTPHIPKAISSPSPSIPEKRNPTILFLHGNTGTRALSLRIPLYRAYTSKYNANVFAIDYRGFGDSQGQPSVDGVAMDARAAWNWLVDKGAKEEDILIVGHSLGTAVAGLLAAQLGKEGIRPRGVVLMSAFSSVREVINTYALFGVLQLLRPLSSVPVVHGLVSRSLKHRFDTLSLAPEIKTSVLLVHADDDWDIPYTHSTSIFESILSQYLPPLTTPYKPIPCSNPEDLGTSKCPAPLIDQRTLAQHEAEIKERERAKKTLVNEIEIEWFGNLQQFTVGERKVAMLKTYGGGHDIGRLEGVQDVIGRMFDLM